MRKLDELIYTSYYVDTQLTVKITDNYTKKNASPAIGGIITIIDGSNNRWTGVCYASPNPDAVVVVQDYWHIDITAYSTPVIDNGNTWYFTQNYYFMGGSPTIPSTLPYLGEISSADYNAGKAVLRMLDSVSWYIDGDSFLNYNFIDLPSAAMSQPYPHALWRIAEGVNDGLPYNGLLTEAPYFGAFANATDLTVVRIPQSVKKIGRESFRGTQLRLVTIARDCEYYPTSFPDGCEVHFYPD